MARLRVRAVAEARGYNLSQTQRYSGIVMNTMRRYWYGTQEGKEVGTPIREVNLETLETIARVLEVHWKDLVEDDGLARLLAAGSN